MATESFLEVTLYVADVRRSAEFYDAIGLGMYGCDFDGMPYHADGGMGVTALQLRPATDRPISRVQLGFRVKELSAITQTLSEKDIDFELPFPRFLRTQDPYGNRVNLAEIAPCRKFRLGRRNRAQ